MSRKVLFGGLAAAAMLLVATTADTAQAGGPYGSLHSGLHGSHFGGIHSAYRAPNSVFGYHGIHSPRHFSQHSFSHSYRGFPSYGRSFSSRYGHPGFGHSSFRHSGFGHPGFGRPGFGRPGFGHPGFGRHGSGVRFSTPGFSVRIGR